MQQVLYIDYTMQIKCLWQLNSHTGDCHAGWSFFKFLLCDVSNNKIEADTESFEYIKCSNDGDDSHNGDDGKDE